MITILDKQKCCGCSACVQRCPQQCIKMQSDNEGFLYPIVELANCIDCGLCEKVCPVLLPYEKREPVHTYAAYNKNDEIRKQSSSGGVFTLLSESVIDEGGVVFGARFDENWQVFINHVETKEDLVAFRGSKYVQARTDSTYIQCEKFLKEGRKVLYSGTPCQIAGLKHFLRKEYDNLITVDFVCHGVPSPLIWGRYLKEVTETAHRAVDGKSTVFPSLNSLSLIKEIRFRDKTEGWEKYRFVLCLNEPSGDVEKSSVLSSLYSINQPAKQNPYFLAFYKNLILRPSCHNCASKGFTSHSDITIGDFWGANIYSPNMYDPSGTSLIMVHSNKGMECFSQCDMNRSEVDYKIIQGYNYVIYNSVLSHKRRSDFFHNLSDAPSISDLIVKTLKPTTKEILDDKIRRIVNLPKRIIKKIIR